MRGRKSAGEKQGVGRRNTARGCCGLLTKCKRKGAGNLPVCSSLVSGEGVPWGEASRAQGQDQVTWGHGQGEPEQQRQAPRTHHGEEGRSGGGRLGAL